MTAHRLGNPARYTNGNGLTIFAAKCACGLDVCGVTLPKLWRAHDWHLSAVMDAADTYPADHPYRTAPDLPHPTLPPDGV